MITRYFLLCFERKVSSLDRIPEEADSLQENSLFDIKIRAEAKMGLEFPCRMIFPKPDSYCFT